HPKSPVGRFMSALAIVVSVIFVAFFTATVTSALTVQQLKSGISGIEDLPGKTVATVTGSTSAAFLRKSGIATIEAPRGIAAAQLLVEKKADAVVFDSPVLQYIAAGQLRGQVKVVGEVFRRENYGILFPEESPLRKPVNAALLRLKEDGTYDMIYRKWFQRDDKG
ncbi:MAG: transporter substrate-binding domain-containing protein, partial [Beijerinckiaceae bacterium]